jgi:hypothetical protein
VSVIINGRLLDAVLDEEALLPQLGDADPSFWLPRTVTPRVPELRSNRGVGSNFDRSSHCKEQLRSNGSLVSATDGLRH